MTITMEAIVEQGLLRPMKPLPFKDKEQVRITIQGCKTVRADTSAPLSPPELGKALEDSSQPTSQQSVALKHTVDYNQVF